MIKTNITIDYNHDKCLDNALLSMLMQHYVWQLFITVNEYDGNVTEQKIAMTDNNLTQWSQSVTDPNNLTRYKLTPQPEHMFSTLNEKLRFAGSDYYQHGMDDYSSLYYDMSDDYNYSTLSDMLKNAPKAIVDGIMSHYQLTKNDLTTQLPVQLIMVVIKEYLTKKIGNYITKINDCLKKNQLSSLHLFTITFENLLPDQSIHTETITSYFENSTHGSIFRVRIA